MANQQHPKLGGIRVERTEGSFYLDPEHIDEFNDRFPDHCLRLYGRNAVGLISYKDTDPLFRSGPLRGIPEIEVASTLLAHKPDSASHGHRLSVSGYEYKRTARGNRWKAVAIIEDEDGVLEDEHEVFAETLSNLCRGKVALSGFEADISVAATRRNNVAKSPEVLEFLSSNMPNTVYLTRVTTMPDTEGLGVPILPLTSFGGNAPTPDETRQPVAGSDNPEPQRPPRQQRRDLNEMIRGAGISPVRSLGGYRRKRGKASRRSH